MKTTITAPKRDFLRQDRVNGRFGKPREGWVRVGVLSGFVATFAMTVVFAVAYGLAQVVGRADGSVVERWFRGLTHNPMMGMSERAVVAAVALNLLVGLGLALVYARFAEPVLSGAGWRRGALFSLVPWLVSSVAFLPLLGGGLLGLDLGAGPLPIVGNLIVHLVYGAVLGGFYAIPLERGLDGSEGDRVAASRAERGAAVGVGVGLVGGALLAWTFGAGSEMAGVSGREAVTVAGALLGAGVGNVLGSLVGFGRQPATT